MMALVIVGLVIVGIALVAGLNLALAWVVAFLWADILVPMGVPGLPLWPHAFLLVLLLNVVLGGGYRLTRRD